MDTPTPSASLASVGDTVLGPDGPVARLLPGYEPRSPQIQMANLCGQTIADGGFTLIEAGTGTGKSLGYLIPAILNGERAVISTDTIALQEQLVGKDLPFLARALNHPFAYAIAKGRTNYFCEANTQKLVSDGTFDPLVQITASEALAQFREKTWDGDKASLRLAIPDHRWSFIAADETCIGKDCPYATDCPYLAAKARYEAAQVIVTNHAMLLLHHQVLDLSGEVFGILPEHAIWIGDEAHTLPDRAGDVFGCEIHDRRPSALVKRILRSAQRLELALENFNGDVVNEHARQFFATFHGAAQQEQALDAFPPEVVALARTRMQKLVEALRPARLSIYWAIAKMDPDAPRFETRQKAAARLLQMADVLIGNLQDFFVDVDDPEPPYVHYVEVTQNGMAGREVTLHRKPVETRPIFKRILGRLRAAIFTSATLTTGKSDKAWKTIAEDLGLELATTATLRVESPFDYARQVVGYVPQQMPESHSPDYHRALAEEVITILLRREREAPGTGTFVLFTSVRDMRKVYEMVVSRVSAPLSMQGEMQKDELIRQFKATPGSVLFGVKTFWTGVDLPGDALACVILCKLPFPQPKHPLNQARCELIERRGGNGFKDFHLPRCIQDVRQGFGRLIRNDTDSGLFAILDGRMSTKGYGRTIAAALPEFECVRSLEDGSGRRNHVDSPQVSGEEGGTDPVRSGHEVGPHHEPAPAGVEDVAGVALDVCSRTGDVRPGITAGATSGDRTGVGTLASDLGKPAADNDGAEIPESGRPAALATGIESGDSRGPGTTPASDSVSGLPLPAWGYLQRYLQSGDRSVCGGVTAEEARTLRGNWKAILAQRAAVNVCKAYLYDEREDPEWDTLDGQLQQMESHFMEMVTALRIKTQAPLEDLLALVIQGETDE